jgi:hypothetical protein
VIVGVTVLVEVRVGVGVTVLVEVRVGVGVTVLVEVRVGVGLTVGVGVKVFVGVTVLVGVTVGVTEGDGVAPLTLSQQSSKLTLKTCSQQPSQSILTYISISVGSIPVMSQMSPVVIPVQEVTPVMLVEVKPV